VSLGDLIFGMFSIDMGIDLGTANTVVCVKDKGIILSEPSVVAVKKGTNEVLMNGEAVGIRAKEMIGKTPEKYHAIRPLKNGVIADFDITKEMLSYFVRKVHGNRRWGVSPRVVIAIPSGGTEVEKRAVVNSAERAGARSVYLIEQPMASAIGAGLPVEKPEGSMICDIGGGTTEVALISLAGIVQSQSLRVGGDAIDDAVVEYMKNAHSLLVGNNMAERTKIKLGSAVPLEQELEMTVKGLDQVTGMPKKIQVSSEEIREAISEPIALIINAIKTTLEKSPPELAADLVDRGVCLAGGTSQLRGFDDLVRERTGLPVICAEDPLTCVARGTGIVLEQLDLLKAVLASGDDI
jgi:rod shape-determining protein MreB and related proteins